MKKKYSRAIVNQITNECCDNIEEMLLELGISYTKANRRLFGSCPIHHGDNPTAWSLYPEGENVRGIWFCRTHHCEEKWKKTLVGFVHAILCTQTQKDLKWFDAVEWMARFLGYKRIEEIKLPNKDVLRRQEFNNTIYKLNVSPKAQIGKTWSRDEYLSMFQVPSQYHIDRGYSKEILIKYDVGYAKKTNRSVVPVYDDEHKTIVGMTARSCWEKCNKCGWYHNPSCSCPSTTGEQINACKWKNSPNFEARHFLYNFWFAKKHIIDSNTIILVEGPGDVWKLEESGIHNSVAIFGTDITEEQLVLLEGCWAMNAIVLMDSDKAGQEASLRIKKKLQRTHRLFFPTLKGGDVGELQTDQITDDILPIINEIKTFNNQVGV